MICQSSARGAPRGASSSEQRVVVCQSRGEGGDRREEEARFVQSRRELVTAVGDNRQETHHADIYTVVFKNTAFSYPALDLPILLPCAPHLPPLFYQSRSLAIGHTHTQTYKHTQTHTHTERERERENNNNTNNNIYTCVCVCVVVCVCLCMCVSVYCSHSLCD